MARRNRTEKERLTPCECCGYPISQRHHLLDYAYHGENDFTAQLCANCHELYHLLFNHFARGSKGKLLSKVLLKFGTGNKQVQYLLNLVMDVAKVEIYLSKKAIEAVDQKRTDIDV